MLIGLDEANQHRIDQYVMRRAFVREHLGQRHAGSAGDRSRRASAARRLGADVEHIDDAAPAALLHLRPRQPRQPDGGEQLLVQVVLQEFVGQLFKRAGGRRAGIVHDDVDLAERLHYFVVGTLDVSGERHVALDADDTPAVRPDGLDRIVERFASARDNGDIGARGCKSRGNGEPDPFASAGDHRRAAGETDVH